ncbi:hypothetical protein ACFY19_25185 [Streptosporangium saharense]|uniref:hypothetical protein n=1 Tax=Streptosporangium saharense TaxID=1706840 RepID=UPI0036A8C96A
MDHSDHTLLQPGGQSAISDRMRELLARAAQDHVYEQRTQGAVLDEIRQRLEGMEWLLREVRERELGGLSGTLESVTVRLDDVMARPPSWAEGLAQHVEAVRDHVDAVGARIGTLSEGVESVGERVVPLGELPSLWADLGTVGENVEEALGCLQALTDGTRDTGELVGERLGRLQTGMEAAAGRFTRLDRTLGELAQRTERLEEGLPELSAGLAEAVDEAACRLSGAVERVSGKIDLVMARIDGLAEDVEDRLGGFDGRLAVLEERVAETGGRLGEVAARHEVRFDTLDERLDDVEGRTTSRIEAVDSRLRALDGYAVQATERLEGLLEAREGEHARRFDSLEECVAQARAALAPLGGMLRAQPDREQLAEALTRAVEPARADLTRRLGALEETMLALAEALLRPPRNDKD